MNFQLTDEQRMIRDSARRFVTEHYRQGGQGLHKSPHSGDGAVDERRWRALAELGFLSLGQPEACGGMGGAAEIALTCQEFGRGPVLEPFVATALFAAQIICHGGTEQQKSTLLPAIAAGESIIAVAYREADNPDGDFRPATTARRDNEGFVLDGGKCLALAAPAANWLIVSATVVGGAGVSLFLVDPRQPGVNMKALPLVDGSWCGDIELAAVSIPAENLLGAEGEGAQPLREGLRYAILGVCGEMAGLATQSLETSIDYIKARKQFGAPLANFQALRHRVADMALDCEMARSALFKLIAAFQVPDQHDPAMTTAMAKATLDDIAARVCSEAIQLHGAMGLTEECSVGRNYARATLIRSLFGSTSSHVAAYAALLRDRLRQPAQGVNCLSRGDQLI